MCQKAKEPPKNLTSFGVELLVLFQNVKCRCVLDFDRKKNKQRSVLESHVMDCFL